MLGLGGTIDNPVTGKIIIHLLFHFVKYDKNSHFSDDYELDPSSEDEARPAPGREAPDADDPDAGGEALMCGARYGSEVVALCLNSQLLLR